MYVDTTFGSRTRTSFSAAASVQRFGQLRRVRQEARCLPDWATLMFAGLDFSSELALVSHNSLNIWMTSDRLDAVFLP